MYSIFPRYGITGNGCDTWTLSIFWGKAYKNKLYAVQHVETFKAKTTTEHNTAARTRAYRQAEYLKAKDKALNKMGRLRQVDPVRATDEPKIPRKKNAKT